jgi:hypothetical protein
LDRAGLDRGVHLDDKHDFADGCIGGLAPPIRDVLVHNFDTLNFKCHDAAGGLCPWGTAGRGARVRAPPAMLDARVLAARQDWLCARRTRPSACVPT